VSLDPGEKVLEPRCCVRDLEFIEQAAVRETDGHRMVMRADINANTQLQRLEVPHGSLLR
jgi:hypothetical protein